MGRVITGVLVGLVIATATPSIAHHTSCPEDSIKVRYHVPGVWHCENVDDFVSGYIENEYRNRQVGWAIEGTVREHPRYWRRSHHIRWGR